ncbi:MAG: ATP-binding protein [Lachnospiraceae bacterium]
MSELYLTVQIAGAIISLDILCSLFFKLDCKERRLLILVFEAVFVFNITNVVAYLLPHNEILLLANLLLQVAESCFVVEITVLIGHMSGHAVPSYLLKIQELFYVILFVFRLTNSMHFLYYTHVEYKSIDGRMLLSTQSGIFHIIFISGMIVSIASIFFFSIWSYQKEKVKLHGNQRLRRRLVVISTAVPFAGTFLFLINTMTENAVPAICMLLEGMIVLFALNKYQFLGVVKSARDMVIDTMNLALIIVDEQFCYLDSNQMAGNIYPLLLEMEEGMNLTQRAPEVCELFEKTELEFAKGECYYEYQISKVYHENKMRGYAICIYDITQRKKYMDQLIYMREEADTKNQRKSAFLTSVSHEIRTPMNVILGMSEIYLHKSFSPRMEYVLKSIYNAGKGLMDIITQILDFSKIEAGKLELNEESYNLEEELLNFANMVYIRLGKKEVKFHIEINTWVPRQLIGDRGKLKVILNNLLSNAEKNTQKGSIVLQVFWEERAAGSYLKFRVEDTGKGMKEEELQHIFETYVQVGDDVQIKTRGTGLGLTITKRLVEQMQGNIQVKSQLGKGTEIQFEVYQRAESLEPINYDRIDQKIVAAFLQKTKVVYDIQRSYPNIKALVVDDMDTNVHVACGILQLYGMKCYGATQVSQVLQMLTEHSYDIIFLDQMMPQMDGPQILAYIKQHKEWAKIPIVALTANSTEENKKFLRKCGFSTVLEKPLNMEVLEEELEKLIGNALKGSVLPKSVPNSKIRILKSYENEVSHMKQELKIQMWEEPKKFLISVHGIKGASRNINAMETAAFAERMEEAAKAEDKDYMQEHLEELLEQIDRTLKKVQEEIQLEQVKTEQVPGILLPETMEKLKEALEGFHLEQAEEIMEKIMLYTYSKKEQELVNCLETMIQNLDYEKGSHEIEAFLEK